MWWRCSTRPMLRAGQPGSGEAWKEVVRRNPELADLVSRDATAAKDGHVSPPVFALKLPEIAWRGILADYRAMLRATTEASDAFHLFTFLACAGSGLGRTAYVPYGFPVFANLYVTLVGPTGESRKTSALRHAEETGKRADDSWRILRGISTAEGLIAQVADPWEEKDKTGKVISQGGTADKRLLIWLGELSAFLRKARQERVAHVVPFLADAWDCLPTLDLPTRNTPLRVTRPYISLVSASTPEWLEGSLSDREIMGGFANRFLFSVGEPKAPIPFPDPPDERLRNRIVAHLAAVRLAWQGREEAIPLSPTARGVWESFYLTWKGYRWPDPLMAALLQRLPDQCLKIALLYAVLEESAVITDELLQVALEVGKYAVASAQSIFGPFYASRDARHEANIRKALEATGGQMPVAELQRKRGGRLSSAELWRVLTAWQSTGQAKVYRKKGEKRQCVSLL